MSIDRTAICDILVSASPGSDRSHFDNAIDGMIDHVTRLFSAPALEQVSSQRWAEILCIASNGNATSPSQFYTQLLDLVYDELTHARRVAPELRLIK